MLKSKDRILYLLQGYSHGTASPAEEQELYQWMSEAEDSGILKEHLSTLLTEAYSEDSFSHVQWDRLFEQVSQAAREREPPMPGKVYMLKFWKRAGVAAVIAVLLGSAFYFWTNYSPRQMRKDTVVTDKKNPPANTVIIPGGNKALLTLADGSTIQLDSASKGTLVQQGSTKIFKTGEGQLAYNAGDNNTAVLYNTLATPRGGQYYIVLPDGTKVWLNAASSLRYPAAFTENERIVELTGEAYFEVATSLNQSEKAVKVPFIVKINSGEQKSEVKVLGTHFNINSYTNETVVKTTLLEGSVKFSYLPASGVGPEVKLNPGQQSELVESGKIKVINDVDVELAVAWKNGYTAFKSMDIKSIMRLVERWYDVDVVYKGEMPGRTFSGEVSRGADLTQLLRIFEASKINFSMEGRKIIVSP